jgi:hypothetical protein
MVDKYLVSLPGHAVEQALQAAARATQGTASLAVTALFISVQVNCYVSVQPHGLVIDPKLVPLVKGDSVASASIMDNDCQCLLADMRELSCCHALLFFFYCFVCVGSLAQQ